MAKEKKFVDPATLATVMLRKFYQARMVGVPLVGISAFDQSAVISDITSVELWAESWPMVQWDAARGLTEVNPLGAQALMSAHIKPGDTVDFVNAMLAVALLEEKTVVFVRNAGRQLHSQEPSQTAVAVQAVQNLRDAFKSTYRMLVMLDPTFKSPPELTHDVVTFEHALPTRANIETIITELHASAGLPVPKPELLAKAVDASTGLPAFEVEQVNSLAMSTTGLDVSLVWEHKANSIKQVPGLSVYSGKETFSDIVGLENVKARLRQRLSGQVPIGVVVWIDEIDKALANVESDTTGTRTYQLKSLLTKLEDNEWEAILLAGLPGGGKSLIGKAFGNEAGVPTISLDLGEMQNSLVGESEARVRQALAVIEAVGDGHAFFVCTSNNATIMRPELQRRMTAGFFFFELLTKAEKAAAWKYYIGKYKLPEQPLPDDEGWTGAEIRNCAKDAWNSRITLRQAAQFILPVARARATEFDEMRQYAHGRFLSAAEPGYYTYTPEPMRKMTRAITLPEGVVSTVPKKEMN